MNISIGNLGGSNPSVNELISQLVSKRTQSLNSLLEQKSSIENTLAALQSGGLGIGSLNNSYSSQIASLQDTIDRLNEQYTLNALSTVLKRATTALLPHWINILRA